MRRLAQALLIIIVVGCGGAPRPALKVAGPATAVASARPAPPPSAPAADDAVRETYRKRFKGAGARYRLLSHTTVGFADAYRKVTSIVAVGLAPTCSAETQAFETVFETLALQIEKIGKEGTALGADLERGDHGPGIERRLDAIEKDVDAYEEAVKNAAVALSGMLACQGITVTIKDTGSGPETALIRIESPSQP